MRALHLSLVALLGLTLCSFSVPPAPAAAPPADVLILNVNNIGDAKGKIWVGVYTGDHDWLDRDKARLVAAEVAHSGELRIDIGDLEEGREYALGLFHDENDNGEFDLNWLGLPAEPWAFSGPVKTRLRLPYFSEVSFVFGARTRVQSVELRKW